MKQLLRLLNFSSSLKALSLMLGSLVIGLAFSTILTGQSAAALMLWAIEVLSPSFLLLLAGLIYVSLLSLVKIKETASIENEAIRDSCRVKWLQAGQQCCNGIATLALTFTLLGISLGIGQLADGSLTPDSINTVIADLTKHFSLAFMTSVVGLPLSALLRTILIIVNASLLAKACLLYTSPSPRDR